GILLRTLGRLGEAQAIQERALAGLRRVLGAQHPETLRVVNSLAMTMVQQDEFAAALRELEKIAPVCRKVLGPNHDETLAVLANMATCHDQLGQRKQARLLWEQVLTIRAKVFGVKHHNTTLCAFMLFQSFVLNSDPKGMKVFRKYLRWLID